MLGSCIGRLKYPVTLKLACTFSTGDSSARQITEREWQILVIIDLYGFSFAVFFPSTINLLVLNYPI